MLYRKFWLESGENLRHVFAKETDTGWEGWVLSDTIPHKEMLKLYVTVWMKGLWHEVTEEHVEKIFAEDAEKQRRSLSYRSV